MPCAVVTLAHRRSTGTPETRQRNNSAWAMPTCTPRPWRRCRLAVCSATRATRSIPRSRSATDGASLAAELGAASADHLVKTSDADIAALGRSDTAAVSLPCTPFGLAERDYTPAQKLLDAGAILALARDCNPGTAWNESMQFVIALACRALKLTPAQAIAASTINAAHAIRRADRIGSIEPGKQADLLVLSVSDYRHLGYRFGANLVRQVIKRGHVYSVDDGYHQLA